MDDFALTDEYASTMTVFMTSKAGSALSWTPTTLPTGPGPNGIAIGHLNSDDGTPDIAVQSEFDGGGSNITVFTNTTLDSTSVACSPTTLAAGRPTTCTATVIGKTDHPSGTVSFTSTTTQIFNDPPITPGKFSSPTCTLAQLGGNEARCSVTYTPLITGDAGAHSITARYSGDAGSAAAGAAAVVHVTAASTTTVIACSPRTVAVGATTTCKITVTAAGSEQPLGLIAVRSNSDGVVLPYDDTVSVPASTLDYANTGNTASCTVTYTPRSVGSGAHKLYAAFDSIPDNINEAGGYDSHHLPSRGTTIVTVTK